MVSARDILIGIGVVILLVGMFWYAGTVTPYPVETFNPDGSHLGDFAVGDNWYNIFHFIFSGDVDSEWVKPNGMIQYLLLPFFAIALVMYGVLSEIPLGGNVRWFNTAMALIIALVVSSSGLTVRTMRGYLTIAGNMAVAFFGFILVLGIALQGLKGMSGMGVPMGAFKSVVQDAELRRKTYDIIQRAEAYANLHPGEKKSVDIQKLASKASIELAQGKIQDAYNTASKIKV